MTHSEYYYQKYKESRELKEAFDEAAFLQDPMTWFANAGWVIPPEAEDYVFGALLKYGKMGKKQLKTVAIILENLGIIKVSPGRAASLEEGKIANAAKKALIAMVLGTSLASPLAAAPQQATPQPVVQQQQASDIKVTKAQQQGESILMQLSNGGLLLFTPRGAQVDVTMFVGGELSDTASVRGVSQICAQKASGAGLDALGTITVLYDEADTPAQGAGAFNADKKTEAFVRADVAAAFKQAGVAIGNVRLSPSSEWLATNS